MRKSIIPNMLGPVAVVTMVGAVPLPAANQTTVHPVTGLPISAAVASLDSMVAVLNGTNRDRRVVRYLDEIWDTVTDTVQYVADQRFDSYTKIVAASLTVQQSQHTRFDSSIVTKPTLRLDVESVGCGIAGPEAQVPKWDEHLGEPDLIQELLVDLLEQKAEFLDGFPDDAADCGEWNEGEDRADTIKTMLFGSWPEHRVYVSWDQYEHQGRDSDDALKDLVFGGMGQHRIEHVRQNDLNFASAGAVFAIYLGFLDDPKFEVKKGFARLGADAYFDADGNPVGIKYRGQLFHATGFEGTERKCVETFVSKPWYKPWKWHWRTDCSPALTGWLHAKMAFRGTLHAVVTIIDHLYGLHLSVANAIVTANVEELEPDDPIRRLLTPFGYRTEAINYQASFALVNEGGLIHRAAPFTVNGLEALFAFARTAGSGLSWATIPERRRKQNVRVNGRSLPLEEDGEKFYEATRALVRQYLAHHYGEGTPGPDGTDRCTADSGLQRWHARVNSIAPMNDLPELNCHNLEGLLATFIYSVTAGHTHVGALAAEVEDPCFAPWAWREGELCGMPQTFLTQALTFALTSLEQPLLADDGFAGLLLDSRSRELWAQFVRDIEANSKAIEKKNEARARAFRTFDTSIMECSVGI